MELYQLRYFQTVAEVGTLREAAEHLAVSQSAVSRAVTLLESEIGVKLFTRRGRANELNRFGTAFLQAHPGGSAWPRYRGSQRPATRRRRRRDRGAGVSSFAGSGYRARTDPAAS